MQLIAAPARLLLVCIFLGSAFVSFVPGEANAAGSTCGNPIKYYDGYQSDPSTNRYGSTAVIEYANPKLCGFDSYGGSESVAYSKVEGVAANGAGLYGLVGYGQFGDGTHGIATYSEWALQCRASYSCGNTTVRRQYSGYPTRPLKYRVAYQGGSGGDNRLHMYVDGAQYDESDYDTVAYWQGGSGRNEFFGQVNHGESDIVGTAFDAVGFTGLQTQHDLSGNWNDVANSNIYPGGVTLPRYKKDKMIGPSAFRIWTDG